MATFRLSDRSSDEVLQAAQRMLAVPVYFAMVGLTMLLADGLRSLGQIPLRPLLLDGILVLRVAAGPTSARMRPLRISRA